MRDWTKTLLSANFRGVPFYVESDEFSGGRRLAVHEVAGGEESLVEDLGAVTRTFDITAYTVGDLADIQGLALNSALSVVGPGFVILPIDGGFMAHVQTFRRSRQKDRAGYIAFDVTFIPAPGFSGATLSVGNVSTAVATDIGLAASAFSRLF
ncbi:DNA circularization N-terminal domain-containing protein [Rhizobium tumorigenes]|uniref:DNA circularization N-terminal domain-containing protein n=1 Tax=Rhizobium tumorigenes TaxID=2041385 RepID=UPI00241F092E|nr:DNA circularization N-terminal domain-containing protein [Rhizobium tumorigenes]WFS01589.1 DNA circularization N-terminal domain-containing protein [Rhizobium tumorigenes]